MKKIDLIREFATAADMTQGKAREALDALQEIVFTHMKEDEIKLFDGVTFTSYYKEGREGRNPQTGEPVEITGRYVPRVKWGRAPKAAINE